MTVSIRERVWWTMNGTYNRLFNVGSIQKKVIRHHLPENPVVIEAGAHNGRDTVELAGWGGHVHAFEPVPEIYSRLKARTRNHRNISCYPLALGTADTVQDLYVSSGLSDGSSSLLEPADHLKIFPKVYFAEKIPVRTVTLDSFIRARVIEPDFLWLDLQGMELPVLQHGTSALKTVSAIYTEVSEDELYRGNTRYDELKDWLYDKGFCPVPVDASRSNVLFVRGA